MIFAVSFVSFFSFILINELFVSLILCAFQMLALGLLFMRVLKYWYMFYAPEPKDINENRRFRFSCFFLSYPFVL